MPFTLCTSICAPVEHVWFEIIFLSNDIHTGYCLQSYFYILWESIVVMYFGKWTFLTSGVGQYEHQIAFLSISVLLMTYSVKQWQIHCSSKCCVVLCLADSLPGDISQMVLSSVHPSSSVPIGLSPGKREASQQPYLLSKSVPSTSLER